MSEVDDVLLRLERTIAAREADTAEKSYTKSLLQAGPGKCAKKLGEEAVECALALVGEDREAVTNEAADVMYHLLVGLRSRNVAWADVLQVLEQRMGVSGHDEKASRAKST